MRVSRVLLVDDDDLLRETLAEALRAAGMIVSEADNGATGFTMVAGGGFDLVVTDLYMPDGDGLELLMRMRDAAIATPVIMMTGGVKDDFGTPDPVTEPSLRAARIFGAVRTLRKPVLPSELMREIGAVAAQPGHDK
jgi:CheY-like chemotaxis protein